MSKSKHTHSVQVVLREESARKVIWHSYVVHSGDKLFYAREVFNSIKEDYAAGAIEHLLRTCYAEIDELKAEVLRLTNECLELRDKEVGQ